MSNLQRAILLVVALVIAIFTAIALSESYVSDVSWLLPVLAVGALLFVAAKGIEWRMPTFETPAPKAPASVQKTVDPEVAISEYAKRSVRGTETFAISLYKATKSDLDEEIAFDLERLKTENPQLYTELSIPRTWAAEETKLHCLVAAYTIHEFRPRRSKRMVPDTLGFRRYRSAIFDILVELDKRANAAASVLIPDINQKLPGSTSEQRVEKLLIRADAKRLEVEQTMNLLAVLDDLFAMPGVKDDPIVKGTLVSAFMKPWDDAAAMAEKIKMP